MSKINLRTTLIQIVFLIVFVVLILRGNMMLWLALFGASLLGALFFGRFYCGYVCPMHTLMRPAEWLSRKLGWQTDRTPTFLQPGIWRWILLVVSVAAVIIGRQVLQRNLPLLPVWVALAVMVTLRFKPAVFHRRICPFGALQHVTGRFAWMSKKVLPEKCIGCKKCERVCPDEAIAVQAEDRKARIETGLCFQCGRCQAVCPTEAILYKNARQSPSR